MTQKQIDQCIAQLPAGQTMSRAYRAFEGDPALSPLTGKAANTVTGSLRSLPTNF